MSKLQVGRVYLSHTFAKKKVWTKSFRVGGSDMDVHTYKSMQNSKIPPNNSRNGLYPPLKLLEFVQKHHKNEGPPLWMFLTPSLRANFWSKMSKLIGQVGRVGRKIYVQTKFCPYQGVQVGRVGPLWTYVQTFAVFFY